MKISGTQFSAKPIHQWTCPERGEQWSRFPRQAQGKSWVQRTKWVIAWICTEVQLNPGIRKWKGQYGGCNLIECTGLLSFHSFLKATSNRFATPPASAHDLPSSGDKSLNHGSVWRNLRCKRQHHVRFEPGLHKCQSTSPKLWTAVFM